jgi:hypothetical protein
MISLLTPISMSAIILTGIPYVNQGRETIAMTRHRSVLAPVIFSIQRLARIGTLAGLLVIAASVSATQAAPIAYEYSGVITSADSRSNVHVGERFSGTFSYDPQASIFSSPPGYANLYSFGYSTTTANENSSATLNFGSSKESPPSFISMQIGVYYGGSQPSISPSSTLAIYSGIPGGGISYVLQFSNQSRVVLDPAKVPTSINLSDFTSALLGGHTTWGNAGETYGFGGTIETLAPLGNSVTAVPEPSAVAMWLGLASSAWAFRARSRSRA